MEPPLPLISLINPFPRRFINRTACFPWKVSYFREFVCHREKNKVRWKVELRSLSFDRFRFILYFHFHDFTAAGTWVSWIKKLMNYPTETTMKRWDKCSERGITERLSSQVFFFLLSCILHVNMHFEKSRWLSVLWTICNFSMISAEKVPGSFDFGHHCGVDFTS